MKVPKRMVRNADGTKTLERPYKVAIVDGEAVRVYGSSAGWVLPDGARWATEADADDHDEVAQGAAHRAANANPRLK